MKVVRNRTTSKRKEKREWVLDDLRRNLQLATNHLPRFGSDLGFINGREAADVVVSHRIISKFAVPTEVDTVERRKSTILKALANDSPWNNPNEYTFIAKARLSYWLRGFKPRYGFRAPTGASSTAFACDDVFVKLKESVWEVSPDCLNYACAVAYNNQSLKRMVKTRFRSMYPYLEMCARFRAKDPSPYACFREQFKSVVTFNAVARIETVPKNNNEDRMITCVPVWDMISQLSFMCDLRRHLRRSLGYDINTRADLHKTLLPHGIATIDLSAASDRVSWNLVKAVWPDRLHNTLAALRTSVASYNLGDSDGDCYHHFEMFSPMGTGITFDVMTLTLLALLRGDRSASVFGDDIIVKASYGAEARKILESVGLVVNSDKSFFSGKFRESCGGMYHDDVGYLVSYDIKYPNDIVDVINIVNKLDCIIAAKQISFEIEGLLLNCVTELKSTLPRVVFADLPSEVGSTHVRGTVRNNSSSVFAAFGVNWNRVCSFHTAYVKKSTTRSFDTGDAFDYARFLYAGSSKPSLKETRVIGVTIETWSGAVTRQVSVQPMVIC